MTNGRPKAQRLIQTNSGRLFTMSGRQVRNVTSVRAVRPSHDTKELRSDNGAKYSSKVIITPLKNYGVYQVHGSLECVHPQQGVEYMNKITMTCDTWEEAQKVKREYKSALKEQMNRFIKLNK